MVFLKGAWDPYNHHKYIVYHLVTAKDEGLQDWETQHPVMSSNPGSSDPFYLHRAKVLNESSTILVKDLGSGLLHMLSSYVCFNSTSQKIGFKCLLRIVINISMHGAPQKVHSLALKLLAFPLQSVRFASRVLKMWTQELLNPLISCSAVTLVESDCASGTDSPHNSSSLIDRLLSLWEQLLALN